MPNTVKKIKANAFQGSEGLAIYPKNLVTLKISKNIKKIERNAFSFTDIKKIYFKKKRPSIAKNDMFDDGMVLKIFYKKKYWKKKYRKKYGAGKVTWKKF